MSTSLDKSLDDIISSTRKAKRVAPKKKAAGKAAGKGIGKAQKKEVVSFKKDKPAPKNPKKAAVLDYTYSTKVVAEGLPRDLKQENVKDFFQSQVGGVLAVSLSYNEKGNFRGIATIVFKSNKNAALAVEKYNNAPIDGGVSKLKLALVIDPSKKPLAARITANQPVPKAKETPKAAPKPKPATKKEQLKEKVKEKRKQLKKAKAKKPAKKTLEQLDQEMSDYFKS